MFRLTIAAVPKLEEFLLPLFVAFALVIYAIPPAVAYRKGYRWYFWILTSCLGAMVIPFFPNLRRTALSPKSQAARQRIADATAICLTAAPLFLIVLSRLLLLPQDIADQRTQTLTRRMVELSQQGDVAGTDVAAQELVRHVEKSFGSETAAAANAFAQVADVYAQQKAIAKSEAMYKRAADIYFRNPAITNAQAAGVYFRLAKTYEALHQHGHASLWCHRALSILERPGTPFSSTICQIYLRLGNMELKDEKYQEAGSLFRKAGLLAEQQLGNTHPVTLQAYLQAGINDVILNQHEEAEQLLKHVVVQYERQYGPDHTDLILPLNALEVLYRNTNRSTLATQTQDRIDHLRRNAPPPP